MSRPTTRFQDLLRVAAPGSGATDAERENAAQRIAELVLKHGHGVLDTEDEPAPRPRVRRREPDPPAAPTIYTHYGDEWCAVHYSAPIPIREPSYHSSIAAVTSWCRLCNKGVSVGEQVQRRLRYGVIEYVHPECWRLQEER